MALHRLVSVTVGVPNVAETASYYTEFGLQPQGDGAFTTADGGEQLRLARTPTRRLVELVVGADDVEDIQRTQSTLARRGYATRREGSAVVAREPVAGFGVRVEASSRIVQPPTAPTPYNGPGRTDRPSGRAPGILRTGSVKPRKLGHVVIGTTDLDATTRFFVDGLGFKPSDYIDGKGAFLRCSTDHHNLLALAAPVNFLHHTSWQVGDVDEVGRGAFAMLEGRPERHVWGLGRHHAGSNFFWYLKDPAGNFSEYYSDMDCIVDDQLWTPGVFEGAKALFDWGPPPPPSFLQPEDLAELMTGAHAAG